MGDLVLFTAPIVVASNVSVNISIRCPARGPFGPPVQRNAAELDDGALAGPRAALS